MLTVSMKMMMTIADELDAEVSPTAEVLCLSLVVVGGGLYSLGDLSFHPTGYGWMFANMVMFVSSQLYEKYAVVCMDQVGHCGSTKIRTDLSESKTAVGISCVQNILSLPILIVFGFFVLEVIDIHLVCWPR